MKIVSTLLLCLTVFLNSIALSSQSKRLPDNGPNPGFHSCGPSSSTSASRHRPETTHSRSTSPYSARASSSAELPVRDRSKSPTLKQTFSSLLGFHFEDLAVIRLIPHNSPNRVFELRRYVFPSDKPIGLKIRNRPQDVMPTGEQIVLSTSSGDVCALLVKLYRRISIRPLFTNVSGLSLRAKINMNSSVVTPLTAEEIMECPSTSHGKITKSYGVLKFRNESRGVPDAGPNPGFHRLGVSSSSSLDRHFSDRNHSLANPHYSAMSVTPAEPPLHDRSNSPTLRETFPKVFGYSFAELPFIRLAPRANMNRILEFRRYVFPPDKPIRLRTQTHVLIPMPTEQKLVFSAPNGDVYAMLEKDSGGSIKIRAMFTPVFGTAKRAKINMNSGDVEEMNAEEIAECPVSRSRPIGENYKLVRVLSRSGALS